MSCCYNLKTFTLNSQKHKQNENYFKSAETERQQIHMSQFSQAVLTFIAVNISAKFDFYSLRLPTSLHYLPCFATCANVIQQFVLLTPKRKKNIICSGDAWLIHTHSRTCSVLNLTLGQIWSHLCCRAPCVVQLFFGFWAVGLTKKTSMFQCDKLFSR